MAISDLDELLRSMEPTLRSGSFVFIDSALPADVTVEASVREPEGLSSVIGKDDADRLGLSRD